MKKLSIIVPVYNQQDLIIRALDSIPKRKDIEVIIIDDGSTDSTFKNCYKWIRQNNWLDIRLLKLEQNEGLGNAKNIGYDEAKGEYIHQLDSDDYLITSEYEKVIEELDGSDMVYINLQINDGTIFFVNKDTQRNYCGGCARFIKKDFLGDTRCPNIRATEDWYLNEELQKKPHTDKFTNITAYHYNYPREGSLYDQYIKGEIEVNL